MIRWLQKWRRRTCKPSKDWRRKRVILKPEFVEQFPRDDFRQDTLYISMKFRMVALKCPCGCGFVSYLSLSPDGRKLEFDGEHITLKPSVGSKRPCGSHYHIVRNEVVWNLPVTA